MKQKSLLTTLLLVLGLGAYTILNTSYSGGFGGNYQVGNCAGGSCHGNSSAATTVTINGLPTFYNTNTSYPISVTVNNGAQSAAGFQIRTNIGTLSTTDGGIVIGPGNNQAGHNQRKSMVVGTATFNLIWTSPATGGTAATFDAAGNAVNFDFGPGGDAWNTAASSNVALPIGSVNLIASQKQNNIELNFTTIAEQNISHFDIQKSTNGVDFANIGSRKAIGKGNYAFTDFEVTNGSTYFYRVKELGLDNTISLSKVATVKFKTESALSIYPTIIENNKLNLIGRDIDGMQLIIFDFIGRKVFSAPAISNTIQLPQLNSGIYFATIRNEASVLKTQKIFIK